MSITTFSFNAQLDSFAHFEPSPVLAVAVSGGVDSLTLCLLAAKWASTHHGRVIALTVDHGLRLESAEEAQWVARFCAAHHIEHVILNWVTPKRNGNIQAAARSARYQLLTDWCRLHGVLHLLTGHHQNDQAETILMRQQRGSGMVGKAGIPAETFIHGVRVLRPLLGLSKQALIEWMVLWGENWINDPSNQNMVFTRNRLRQQLQQNPAQQLQLLRDASTAGGERQELEYRSALAAAQCITLRAEGYATLNLQHFATQPYAIQRYLLGNILTTISGQQQPPREEKLVRLLAVIAHGPSVHHTVHGCLLTRKSTGLLITRELSAAEASSHAYSASEIYWDNRFICSANLTYLTGIRENAAYFHEDAPALTLAPLGHHGFRQLENIIPRHLPKSAALVLPALWRLEELLSCPHISHQGETGLKAHFRPRKAFASQAFYPIVPSDLYTDESIS